MVVSSERQASVVLCVPPYIVANSFKDVMCIKEFSKDNLISCCLLETGMSPSTVGSVRRIVLSVPMYRDTILRERLSLVEEDQYRTRIRMDYVPCSADEAYRSPFGEEGTKSLFNASTLITVTSISSCPNRCFLEISAKFDVGIVLPPDSQQRPSDDPVYNTIDQFWKLYVSTMATALETYLFSSKFVVDMPAVNSEFESEFFDIEDTLCQWTAKSCQDISRLEAVGVLEKTLNLWTSVYRELKHQQMISSQLAADVKGLVAVTAEKVRSLAADSAAQTPETYTAPAAVEGYETLKMDYVETQTEELKKRAEMDIEQCLQKVEHVPFFSPGGGRCLSASRLDDDEAQKSPLEHQSAVSPRRNTPKKINIGLLRNFLTEIGTINERVAQTLFNLLDGNKTGFLTEEEVSVVLSHIDTLGLYEDKDGTIRQMDERRWAVGAGVRKTNAVDRFSYNSTTNPATEIFPLQTTAAPPAQPGDGGGLRGKAVMADPKSPLKELLCRHNEEKKAILEELLKKRAAQMVSNFAYRTSGKLHYDEFCLMMLHLLKEY